MPLDARYVTTISLEEYLVNKDDGQPLAFGTVEFWQDDNRVVPKLVYELTGAPPNYTYTPFPNPITLSSVGTISDNNGANTPIYYFPYDADGNIQLYYVVVRNSLGVIQFVREGWPNTTTNANPGAQGPNIANELSNPQFVDVLFIPSTPLVIPLTGAGTTTVTIAPRWDLIVSYTATTTITVTRTPIAGVSAYPGNPPYTLTILPGLHISTVQLRQRLVNNPDIFGRAVGGENGYISASILLAPLSTLNMTYQPNGQPAQVILNANNTSGQYEEFTNTIQLIPANNPSTGDTGYVDIILNLPIVGATTFSNVQIVGLDSNIQGVMYDQVPSNRERDFLFNYYNPLLQYKPISSFLIGWDFALNPAQPLTSTCGPFATGANTSNYIWDQTILFQGVNNQLHIARNADNQSLNIIAGAATTSFAIIQYLDEDTARNILQNPLSVNVAGISGGFNLCISLWFTTDVSLPNMGANQSLVATLDANGKPTTFHGNWTEIPRSNLGNAIFTLGPTTTGKVNDYGFSGWDLNGAAGTTTATFFAIVIGCPALGALQSLDFESVSLVPGSIPTRPAPQSISTVYNECKYYYRKTFQQNVVPAQAVGIQTGDYTFPSTKAGATAASISPFVSFDPYMRATPILTIYNPLNADAQILDQTTTVSCTGSSVVNLTPLGFYFDYTGDGGAQIGYTMCAHYTADARLGIV